MEDFKMVPYMRCSECIKYINSLNKNREKFLKQRAGLTRCQGCEKLVEFKK